MNQTETLVLLGALAASAVGGYAAAWVKTKLQASETDSSDKTPAKSAPAKERGQSETRTEPEQADEQPQQADIGWRSKVFEQWSGVLAATGAIATALVTYQLTKDIGKGDLEWWQQVAVVASAAAFAVGVALLVMTPVNLRTRSRVLIYDVVRRQERFNAKRRRKKRRKLVAPSSLFGYPDLAEFEVANTDLVERVREEYWDQGREPTPEILAKVKLFNEQRRRIEDSVETVQLRRASTLALVQATAGMILAVAGYACATLLTNQGMRVGSLADAKTEQQNKLQEKVLDDNLEDPGHRPVLPDQPSPIIITFPNNATAINALGLVGVELGPACLESRAGTTLEVGEPPPGVPESRIVYVALPQTSGCSAAAGWIDPKWITGPAESKPTTSPSPSPSDPSESPS